MCLLNSKKNIYKRKEERPKTSWYQQYQETQTSQKQTRIKWEEKAETIFSH